MTDRFPHFLNPAVDSNGDTLAGAQLFFYQVGTSTKKDTYSDGAKTIANANPLVADAGGRFGDIFMLTDEQYKVVLAPAADTDPPGSPIGTWDFVSPVRENPVASIVVLSKSADYTVLAADKGKLIEVDASSGPVVITLLATAAAANGFFLYVKKIDSSANTVTVDADTSEEIDGALTAILDSQYDIVGVGTDGTKWSRLNTKSVPSSTTSDAGSSLVVNATGSYVINEVVVPARNYIINPEFKIAQRGLTFDSATTPANSDDTYLLDRWLFLSDGNDRADISRETTIVPTGANAAIKLDVETVSGTSEKFGIVQIIEAADAADLIGGTASLSFKARTSGSQVENLRAHLLAWDGTADTVTSDVILTWEGEGTNPTFVTNWTAENVAVDLALSNEFQEFKIENISIDTANAVNLAVLIHVDDTDLVAADMLYISDVNLVKGTVALPIIRRPIADEVALCRRFYQKSYSADTAPGTITSEGAMTFRGVGSNDRRPIAGVSNMRAVPTFTFWNPNSGASGSWRDRTAAADRTATVENEGDAGGNVSLASSTAGNVHDGHWTAEAEL